MGWAVVYDPNKTPQPVVNYLPQIDEPLYRGQANTLINPDLASVVGQPQKYWKVVGTAVQLMSGVEQQSIDAALLAAQVAAIRSNAVNAFVGFDSVPIAQRAAVSLTVQEFNILINWVQSFTATVAAATSLTDLKTRVAALSAPNSITLSQVKAAIISDINAGNEDNT